MERLGRVIRPQSPMPFRIIIITQPFFFHNEAALLTEMTGTTRQTAVNSGNDSEVIFHIRKPDANIEEMRRLIVSLPTESRNRIVVHSHYSLVPELGLRGAHLGKGRMLPPAFPYDIPTSYSCHSLEEVVVQKSQRAYVFLSPVFSSISKKGYESAFSKEALDNAFHRGIIDKKVVALGGITPQRIPAVKEMGFGGAALLGSVWQSADPVAQLTTVIQAAAGD